MATEKRLEDWQGRWQKTDSDLFSSLLSALKNIDDIATQSKCHCEIYATSILITLQSHFFYGFCIEIVHSGIFDGIHMLKEATQVCSYSLASQIDLCGKCGYTAL